MGDEKSRNCVVRMKSTALGWLGGSSFPPLAKGSVVTDPHETETLRATGEQEERTGRGLVLAYQ